MNSSPSKDLAARSDEAIAPDLPIFDAHHHLWDRPGRAYLIDEFLADIESSGHKIVGTALVESGSFSLLPDGLEQAQSEARRAAIAAEVSSARSGGLIKACSVIVGHVDLRLGDAIEPWLDRLETAAGGRLRAIRHCGTWDSDETVRGGPSIAPPGLFADPNFRTGLGRLHQRGLAFDCWAYQTQHEEVIDLARTFEELPMVYNHVGGVLGIGPYADREEELRAGWFAGMTRLAALPNLYVKLGGLGMKRSGFPFYERAVRPSGGELAAAWRPWLEPAIELFGARRCMFESNFPVDGASCSYRELWNCFKIVTAGASDEELAALFHDTAIQFYRA